MRAPRATAEPFSFGSRSLNDDKGALSNTFAFRLDASNQSFRRLLKRGRVVEQDPFNHGNWQTAILNKIIVELAEPKIVAVFIFVTAEQIHDLPFADDVADFLCRA